MLILALETVTRAGSLALWNDGSVAARIGDPAITHGIRLPGEIIDFLARHGRSIADTDLFAVVSGPGSFTGLRVGIATVQGLALAGGRQVIAIPTLDAMAASIQFAGTPRPIVVTVLDGQRREIFIAAYEASSPSAADWPVLMPPNAGPVADFTAELASIAGARPVTIVGHVLDNDARTLLTALPRAEMVGLPMSLAEAAVRLAAQRTPAATSPHAIRPIYVRRPDVVVARERARAIEGSARRPPSFLIRRADVSKDLPAVERLQQQTFTNPWSAAAIQWELENTDVARLYVLEEPHGAVVAYCACWIIFDELHINSLAVDVAWRRRGAARALLRQVLADAGTAGARAATLEVRRSNEAACALYGTLGFVVEGVRRDYYQAPREDALVLWNRQLATASP